MKRNDRFVAAASIICFVFGLALSHRIEPGVRVQKVTLAEETPALEFLPAGPGPHPVALLAHGITGSKETLFRYAEALTGAGFVCYDVDLPGHGASRRTFTVMDTVHTLEAVAREVGPVDVFVGDSMGGFAGGEAVRERGMKPGLFIAVGSSPVLGDNAPPLLFLEGRFDELYSPAFLKARTDARLVIAPWADHVLELWDPLLVNTAVQAACAAVHKTPPAPPAAWRWRLIGAVLAMLAAGNLANCLTDLFPRLARFHGVFIGVFVVVAFMLTVGGKWLDVTPHLRFLPKQGITMAVTFLLATVAGKPRIGRWSFAAISVLVVVIVALWLAAHGSVLAARFAIPLTLALIAGAAIGWMVARRVSRLQGDVAMAIFVGCAAFQWMEWPRKAAEPPPKSHVAIKLAPKQCDAYVGEYQFPPDNYLSWTGTKLTIWRQGDQLKGHTTAMIEGGAAFEIHPESETNFFVENSPLQLSFIKNDKEETTAVILHVGQGLPDSEGKKLKGEE